MSGRGPGRVGSPEKVDAVTHPDHGAPLPALPIVRTSERKDFRRCPQRWVWGWRNGLRRPGHTANAFWFGIGVHQVLAHWYCGPGTKRGRNPLKVWRDYVGEEISYVKTLPDAASGVDGEPVWVEARALGEAMLTLYFDTYGKDPTWHVIAPEQTFQMTVPNAEGGPMAIYAGTFDLVYRDLEDELIRLGEHKTAKDIVTGHLSIDDQAGGYWAVATDTLRHQNLIGPKDALAGITYNFLRKKLPDPRPQDDDGYYLNKDGTVSKVQPAPLLVRENVDRSRHERQTQIRRIQAEARNMQAMRKGLLPVYKNTNERCQWDCSFFDMCQLHEAGNNWQDYRDAMYVVRDPYADHRKSAAE